MASCSKYVKSILNGIIRFALSNIDSFVFSFALQSTLYGASNGTTSYSQRYQTLFVTWATQTRGNLLFHEIRVKFFLAVRNNKLLTVKLDPDGLEFYQMLMLSKAKVINSGKMWDFSKAFCLIGPLPYLPKKLICCR